MKDKIKVYFANDLFSEATQDYNTKVVNQIREAFSYIRVYNPQENEGINAKTAYADSVMIAQADTDELLKSDVLIAVLDGQGIDAGAASEIGVFYTTGRPIIGVYTDPRRSAYGNQQKKDALDLIAENQVAYINLYTVGLIKQRGVIVTSTEELIGELKGIFEEETI